MKSHTLAVWIVLALAAPALAPVAAADMSASPATEQMHATRGFLGVLLEPVPDALRFQLGQVLPPGQGVMIQEVTENSPAAKAGLQPYDVLLAYNDQKLFSAEQLSHLVRAEAPNTSVKLRVLRGGGVQTIAVMLGQTHAMSESGRPEWRMRHHPFIPDSMSPQAAGSNWDRFDSMSLQKLKDGKFKAEIKFLGKDGKLVTQDFTGTRDAIRHQIHEQKDLPPTERHQLLSALSARDMFFSPAAAWSVPGAYPPPWFSWPPVGY